MTVEVESLSTAIAVAETVAWMIGVLVMLLAGLLLYLLVRPSRRARELPPQEDEAVNVEEMLRLIDRMEDRLEVLERALAEREGDQRVLEPAGGRQVRRMK